MLHPSIRIASRFWHPLPTRAFARGGEKKRAPALENVPGYAAPMRIPTASTMAPPSTIWNTACRNGVSM